MGKRALMTVVALFVVLQILLSGGCTLVSPLVGKWQDTKTGQTVEFTRTGDVIIKASGFVITGKYELVGNDVVKLRLEGWGALATVFGADTWQYQISGDTMTVTVAGSTSKFKRVQ